MTPSRNDVCVHPAIFSAHVREDQISHKNWSLLQREFCSAFSISVLCLEEFNSCLTFLSASVVLLMEFISRNFTKRLVFN